MRQSEFYGSVRKDEIFNLHLESGAGLESASPAFCKTPAAYNDSITANNQTRRSKKSSEKTKLHICIQ